MASKCKRTTIKFKTKRGKTIQFTGKSGSNCPPRKKPSTAHLRVWKNVMKEVAPGCKRKSKGNVKVFRRCVGNAMKSATPR